MGLEFKGSGAEETITEITFEKGFGVCKETFKLKGNAIATSGPGLEQIQSLSWTGATLEFGPEANMENLKFGSENAEFIATLTPRMTDPKSLVTENPITATTTT